MMTDAIPKEELKEIFDKSKEDGAKLYSTADSLHKLSQRILILIGIIGVVSGFGIMQNVTIAAGFIVIGITLAFCAIMHMIQIVITNSSKVLVHILFTNLAIINKEEKNESI
jgi:hypothetical protein